MGRTLDIHPLVVLIVTALGGFLAGIVGLILAVPFTVIAGNAIGRLRSRGFFGVVADRAEPTVRRCSPDMDGSILTAETGRWTECRWPMTERTSAAGVAHASSRPPDMVGAALPLARLGAHARDRVRRPQHRAGGEGVRVVLPARDRRGRVRAARAPGPPSSPPSPSRLGLRGRRLRARSKRRSHQRTTIRKATGRARPRAHVPLRDVVHDGDAARLPPRVASTAALRRRHLLARADLARSRCWCPWRCSAGCVALPAMGPASSRVGGRWRWRSTPGSGGSRRGGSCSATSVLRVLVPTGVITGYRDGVPSRCPRPSGCRSW